MRDTLRLPRKDDFKSPEKQVKYEKPVFLVNEDPLARELVNRILNSSPGSVLCLTDKEWRCLKNSVVSF